MSIDGRIEAMARRAGCTADELSAVLLRVADSLHADLGAVVEAAEDLQRRLTEREQCVAAPEHPIFVTLSECL